MSGMDRAVTQSPLAIAIDVIGTELSVLSEALWVLDGRLAYISRVDLPTHAVREQDKIATPQRQESIAASQLNDHAIALRSITQRINNITERLD